MLFLKNVTKAVLFLSLGLILNCVNSPSSPNPLEPQTNSEFLNYQITIKSFHEDSIEFHLSSNMYTEFILPYHFFDNPVNKIDGIVIKDLMIIDDDGKEINYSTRTEKIGPINNTVISLTGDIKQPVTFSYKINPDAIKPDETIDLDAYDITDSTFVFLGNAAFILPFTTEELVPLWRNPHNITVDVKCKPGIPLYGIPSTGSFACRNIYELIFCQIYAGKKPFLQGYGGGIPFSFLNFTDNTLNTGDYSAISDKFSDILDVIWRTYGVFNDDMLTVSLTSIGGGLEGTFSFTQLGPSDKNFYYVLAHEALHQFVGIRCGEYDDPWWKEGGTTYLSYLIALRLNLVSKDDFKGYITKKFTFPDSSGFKIALSDQWLRANMFPAGRFGIVYDQGSQVMMLLDYETRVASKNRYSIEDISAFLVKRFDGGAFHRSDFLNAFTKFGSPDVSNIFKTYVDSAGAHPSDSLLKFTFNKLDSLGAF